MFETKQAIKNKHIKMKSHMKAEMMHYKFQWNFWLVKSDIVLHWSLHWLPVTFRIDFKVLLLVYKSLNGLGPKYIADMLTEYKPNRPLRSLGSSQLEIPRVHTKQGESAFSYYAARSWNQLPEEIRCAKTLATFKSRLKTHLFSCAFVEWALCYVRTDCIVFYV